MTASPEQIAALVAAANKLVEVADEFEAADAAKDQSEQAVAAAQSVDAANQLAYDGSKQAVHNAKDVLAEAVEAIA